MKRRPSRYPVHPLDKPPRGESGPDWEFRNGGAPVEDREGGARDLVGEFGLVAQRPDILANDLARMGWTENGDDPADFPNLE